jgi:predicted transcriptional regulator
MPTNSQFRAARSLLDWKQSDLAKAAGVSEPSIKRLERDVLSVSQDLVQRTQAALESAGIEFIQGSAIGVKLRVSRK